MISILDVTQEENGTIVVTVDNLFDLDPGFLIHFDPAAISNRMVVYGLSDEREAIEALVREHEFRMDKTIHPEGAERHHRDGGVHSEIEVGWGCSPKKVRAIVKDNKEKLDQATAYFTEKYKSR